jgi:RNA polymerase sigma factor (TIGR02999 family)
MADDITVLLQAAATGDRAAADRATALLYDELHRLARSRMRRSGELTLLDTTALVHECWVKLAGAGPRAFEDRRFFLGFAAKVMRSIVVDAFRAAGADRRGGGAEHLTLNTAVGDGLAAPADEPLRVDEALAELARLEPRLAQVVEMRYFAGCSEAEIAEALGVTERTVQRDWQKARLLLARTLRG